MLVKKVDAVAEYDRIFLRTARMFEDLCRLAGNDALAERVRPSSRSPGRTEQRADVIDDLVAEALGGDTVQSIPARSVRTAWGKDGDFVAPPRDGLEKDSDLVAPPRNALEKDAESIAPPLAPDL